MKPLALSVRTESPPHYIQRASEEAEFTQELDALSRIAEQLLRLDRAQRQRVLAYLASVFSDQRYGPDWGRVLR